jgi:hypothetical protein
MLQRLEDSYESTLAVKEAKLYILKDKYAKFKMLKDESMP